MRAIYTTGPAFKLSDIFIETRVFVEAMKHVEKTFLLGFVESGHMTCGQNKKSYTPMNEIKSPVRHETINKPLHLLWNKLQEVLTNKMQAMKTNQLSFVLLMFPIVNRAILFRIRE